MGGTSHPGILVPVGFPSLQEPRGNWGMGSRCCRFCSKPEAGNCGSGIKAVPGRSGEQGCLCSVPCANCSSARNELGTRGHGPAAHSHWESWRSSSRTLTPRAS